MATPTGNQLFDVVLTNMLLGFANGKFVGLDVAPLIPVDQYKFQYVRFDDDSIYLNPSRRAPTEEVKRFSSDFGSSESEVFEYAIEYELPDQYIRTKRVHGVDLERRAMMRSAYSIELEQEFTILTKLINPANYPTSNKITLSGSAQFSDPSSNPRLAFQTARNAIYDQCGVYPNKTIMSMNAFQALQRHPATTDRFSGYANRSNLIVNADDIAEIYGLGELMIATAAYRPLGTALSAARVKMVTNHIWMGYCPSVPKTSTELNELVGGRMLPNPNHDMANPAAMYTFVLDGQAMVAESPYFERRTKTHLYPTSATYNPEITQATAAYLFSSVVA